MDARELACAVVDDGEQNRSVNRWGVTISSRGLLECVWASVAPELASLASALGVSIDRRDDVLQDVYLAAMRGCPQNLERDELRRWLFRVTANRCHLEHRRGRRWRNVWNKLVHHWRPWTDGADRTDHCDERHAVAEALAKLDFESRTILVLRYFHAMTSVEIGHALGIPDSTVRSRLRGARFRLAAALKRGGYDDDDV